MHAKQTIRKQLKTIGRGGRAVAQVPRRVLVIAALAALLAGFIFVRAVMARTLAPTAPQAPPQAPLFQDVCGDGVCGPNETANICSQDCQQQQGPVCGDNVCEQGEDPNSCPLDCAQQGPVCGDNSCDPGEDSYNCPQDCGQPGPVCGNAQCEGGENTATCPADCPAVEAPAEPSATPGSPVLVEPVATVTPLMGEPIPRSEAGTPGGGIIEPLDEGREPTPGGMASAPCGDNICSPGETVLSCPVDCKLPAVAFTWTAWLAVFVGLAALVSFFALRGLFVRLPTSKVREAALSGGSAGSEDPYAVREAARGGGDPFPSGPTPGPPGGDIDPVSKGTPGGGDVDPLSKGTPGGGDIDPA